MTWKEHLRKGSLALARQDYPFAQTELTLALHAAESSVEDQPRLSIICGLLAQSFFKHANYEQAEPLLKQAIALESLDMTRSGTSAKTRDLICLAEILRHKGRVFEALDCLDSAVLSFQEPDTMEEISGSEEFDALKNLFAVASQHQQSSHKKSSNSRPKKLGFVQEAGAHHNFIVDESSSRFGKLKPASQTDFSGADELAALEEEYINLVDSAQRWLPAGESTPTNRDHHDHKLIETLIRLVRVSLKLELTEQPERILDYATTLAFGKNHAKQLAIPNSASHLDAALIIELMLAKADFYSHCSDYAAAAKCFADLMKWLEKHEHNANIVTESESSVFVTSFIYLMQKADLYASARLLIKQAIEFEEYGETVKALSIYDKSLLIYEQLFPHNHLEIAQVLQFKAAALALLKRLTEAEDLERQAEAIENEIVCESVEIENRAAKLPALVF